MEQLLNTFRKYARTNKLQMIITVTPSVELRIHIFAVDGGKNHIEGSDQEIACVQNMNFERCAEIALDRLVHYVAGR